MTATGENSTGWVKNAHRSIDELGVAERTDVAIDKALRSRDPREVPAGRMTVILEPAAVAGLLGPLRWALDAKSYDRGTSALSGKLGEQVIDPRFSLRNEPIESRLLGNGFDGRGLPSRPLTWV